MSRRICIVDIESTPGSAYEVHRYHGLTKNKGETDDAFQTRTWKECAHYNEKNEVFIPGMSFKKAIDTACRKFGGRVAEDVKKAGSGQQKWFSHFTGGYLPVTDLMLGVKKDDMKEHPFPMPRKDGNAVIITLPIFKTWKGQIEFHVFDDLIPNEVFERHLNDAGQFVGVGQWRAENGGLNGRFTIKKVTWKK